MGSLSFPMSMIKKITNLIFEAFMLKEIKHEGRRMIHMKDPDSVAEHSLNAAQIWYILAKMEWADANKVATMLVWHDLAETRIGDVHKVWAWYIKDKKQIEKKVMEDQLAGFDFGPEIKEYFDEYENRLTIEWKIAKDADYLEQAFQAKIYMEIGYEKAHDRIENVGNALKTESAKKVWDQMIKMHSTDRWKEENLKDLSNV